MLIETFKNTSLRIRLIWAFIAVGIIPMVVVAILATSLAYNAISGEAYAMLESVREAKKDAIEQYGNQIIRQIQIKSSDPEIVDVARKFTQAYNALTSEADQANHLAYKQRVSEYYHNEFGKVYAEKNVQQHIAAQDYNYENFVDQLSTEALILQYGYIADNPEVLGSKEQQDRSRLGLTYDAVHAKHHPVFLRYLEAFGYYDIFLVDSVSGNVVYSVFKEIDFGTNLLSGAFSATGLSSAFRQAKHLKKSGDYALVDYQNYTPSYEAPASFIASPIYDGDDQVAVLVFQMPLDRISAVMNQRSGLGKTGEAYLVGKDRLLRSDTYKYPKNYSVDATFRAKRSVDSEAVQLALQNKKATHSTTNYMQESVLASFTPVHFGPLIWGLVVDIETQEAYAGVSELLELVLMLALLVVVFLIVVALKFSQVLDAPVSQREAFFRAITETAADPILLVNDSMILGFYNPVTYKLFGYDEKELVGKKFDQLIPDCTSLKELMRRLNEETVGITKSGEKISFTMSCAQIHLNDNSTQFACILHDITAFKSLERELAHSQKLESVGQLAAGVAHEINTPAQFVSVNLRFLQESVDELFDLLEKLNQLSKQENWTENAAGILQLIREADLEFMAEEIPLALSQSSEGMARVSTIVKAMKDYSHPGGDPHNADINAALQSTITVATSEWKQHAQLATHLDKNLPLVPCVVSDINQVVLNIIVNATHAIVDKHGEGNSAEGLIGIGSYSVDQYAVIEIRDNGAGMDEQVKSRIFDPFFTTKEVGKGTGQGMSIAHRIIVEKHRGKIEISSELGEGTCFSLYLPLTAAADAIDDAKSA